MTPQPFKVGDTVTTKFSGRLTFHTIVAVRQGRNVQGGWFVEVAPEVSGSRDRDNVWDDGQLSACWFTLSPLQRGLFA